MSLLLFLCSHCIRQGLPEVACNEHLSLGSVLFGLLDDCVDEKDPCSMWPVQVALHMS